MKCVFNCDLEALADARKQLAEVENRTDSFGQLVLATQEVDAITDLLNAADNLTRKRGAPAKAKLAIIMRGGIVQEVITDQPGCVDAVVVDYDCNGTDAIDVDGENAWVYDATPGIGNLDLDSLYLSAYGTVAESTVAQPLGGQRCAKPTGESK